MTDRNERDALAARLRSEADRKECVPTRTPTLSPASRWLHPAELRTQLAQAAEALAAPAEGDGAVAQTCSTHVKGETGYCTFLADVPFGAKLYSRPAATAVVPDGFVLVPRVPTEAMLIAGVDAGVKATPDPWCPKTWAAMLAAAPAAPKGGVVDEAMVQKAERAYWPAYSEAARTHGRRCHETGMRAALAAALATGEQP